MLDCVAKIESNYSGAQGAVVNDRDEIQTHLIQPQLKKTSFPRMVVSLARQSGIVDSPCRYLSMVLSDYDSTLCKRRNAVVWNVRLEEVQNGLDNRTKTNRDDNSSLSTVSELRSLDTKRGAKRPQKQKYKSGKLAPKQTTGSFELERSNARRRAKRREKKHRMYVTSTC